jgi:hypothetical protein
VGVEISLDVLLRVLDELGDLFDIGAIIQQ